MLMKSVIERLMCQRSNVRRVSRVFKITRKAESELDNDTFSRLSSDTKNNRNILRALASSAQSMLSGRSSYDYHLALEDDVNDMKELGILIHSVSAFFIPL
ncbi:hypothetical protein ANCCAN_28215 [Ancylostoma caninum]|uniref:Uncharacterized protein n=1 Tax=Ancylostoma caninum TaxID=29170 RepID=A0A368F599_ANCCA|nr:hypothetical protein ANCCAN_28215 [Ancylostoma caninum]